LCGSQQLAQLKVGSWVEVRVAKLETKYAVDINL